MAYLLDPAEGKYRLDDLALRYLSLEVRSPDAEPGTLDLDGERRRPSRPVGEPRSFCGSRARWQRPSKPVSWPTSTSGSSCPLVRVLAKMEAAGIRIDREFLDDAVR